MAEKSHRYGSRASDAGDRQVARHDGRVDRIDDVSVDLSEHEEGFENAGALYPN